jgi:signal transduction histidine kinase
LKKRTFAAVERRVKVKNSINGTFSSSIIILRVAVVVSICNNIMLYSQEARVANEKEEGS